MCCLSAMLSLIKHRPAIFNFLISFILLFIYDVVKADCGVRYLNTKFYLPEAMCLDKTQPHLLEHSVNFVFELLVKKGDIVIDIMSGYGLSYVPLGHIVGEEGTLVAIEKSRALFLVLQENAIANSAWNRTLLVHANPSDLTEETKTQTLSGVVEQIGVECPHFLRINEHPELNQYDQFATVLGGYLLLERCQPAMLIDLPRNDPAGATALLEYLSVLQLPGGGSYNLFWHSLWTDLYSENGILCVERIVTETIVALPPGHRSLQTLRDHPTDFQAVESESYFHSDNSTLWENVEARLANNSVLLNESRASQGAALRVRAPVSVYLEDVLALNTSLLKTLSLVGTNTAPAWLYTAVDDYDTLRSMKFTYSFSSAFQVDNFSGVASGHCFLWRQRLLRALALERSDEVRRWMVELLPMQTLCSEFVSKRLRTLYQLLSLRAHQQNLDNIDVKEHILSNNMEGDGDTQVETSKYRYYQLENESGAPLDSEQVMVQWFARSPLRSLHDEVACGEPIWCGHTQEMQRRIRAWQFPEEDSRPLLKHSDPLRRPSIDIPASNVTDWSVRPRSGSKTRASCLTSKFLVYEPPSDKHGIGSILELIASTFRYAICLDRILVLNPYQQAPTALKWMQPGCQGSFAECFFESVSGCVLSEEEIAAAPVSSDGDMFNTFPLREERVLVLKGMPLVGECTLCHNEWSKDNRFFDGFYMGESTFDISRSLLHMTAFRSSIKLTWASQFLRYLLRPRPWLHQAVSLIVHHSMRSPASPERLALPISAFPRRFLSLHVRFGMKVAEAVLQPLSKYMAFIARKLPEVTDIFVSTETEEVIDTLIA